MDKGAIMFKNNKPIFDKINYQYQGFGNASISNSRGRPLLLTDGVSISDGHRSKVKNDSVEKNGLCLLASVLINVGDSSFYLLQQRGNMNYYNDPTCSFNELSFSLIKRNGKNEFYIDPTKKKIVIKNGKPSDVMGISVCRKEDGSYYFNNILDDSLFIYSLDNNISLKNSISLMPFSTFAALPPQPNIQHQITSLSFFNHSGNKIFILMREDLVLTKYLIYNGFNLPLKHNAKLLCFDFDKITANISNPKVLWNESTGFNNFPNVKPGDFIEYTFFDQPNIPAFSLNDDFLYLNVGKCRNIITNGRPDGNVLDSIATIQINTNTKTIDTLNHHYYYYNMKQFPDGRVCNYYYNEKKSELIFDVIEFPNLSGNACKYQTEFIKVNYSNMDVIHGINMYHYFDYLRFDYKVTYDCKASIQFVNNSFSEAQFSDYTWYINKLNGKTDTLYGNSPSITIGKSGKYPYKVFGHSPSKHYGEWFYDTLYIDIPEKPVANFNTKDSIVCRYLPVHFNNLSHTKDINPNSTVKYVWTFGDGSLSSNVFEPSHTFTQPGYYTVSLFYSNGYCDSTLVKNQYIHVVDAPKPGFTLANKQGCSPFIAQFTDTVSLNVTKKEYLFSDSLLWKPISSPKFNYTFTKPGHYWAVQKLYGYTGCIIRTDSVQVFVSKGLLTSDSIRIVSASFNLDNILRLDWRPNLAATNYQVYKSVNGTTFLPLVQTKDTFSFDKSIPSNVIYYKVKGIDSCGSFSSSLNIVSPAFISGNTVNGNEAAQINHNLPQGLGVWLKTELLGSFDNKFQFATIQTNPSNPFNDNDFARQDYLRKCYRLSSSFASQEMYSNTFCMDYVPVVYIPNSFTPDGNGLNDKFGPLAYGIESYTITIYNNWGEILYTGSKPWDGRYKEEVVMDGVYFYQVSLIENSHNLIYKKGIIHVLK